jgi:hypothetical protein
MAIRCAPLIIVVWLSASLAAHAASPPDEPTVIPVGLDAYRQWDQWPLQRIGARAYMRSTYDRRGGNEGADASHFLYQEHDDFNVALDVEGPPGVLNFARFNHWHGSPWHFEVDGINTVVCESSTADPTKPAAGSTFEPKAAFPRPLAWTWADTKGADLSWVPMGFEKSLRLAYSRTHYGTGYYIYHQYAPGTKLSRPIKAWNAKPPDADVLELIDQTSRKPAAAGSKCAAVELMRPGVLRELSFRVRKVDAEKFAAGRLRITWDGRATPSVDAPVALFFGAGSLYNRDGREFLVQAFPMSIRFTGDDVVFTCRFPMPYFKTARIEVDCQPLDEVWVTAVVEDLKQPANHLAYFHATYRDHPTPERGNDLVLLDTRDLEGSRDWTGSFVGTSFTFSHNAVLTTLEGDPRFFFDDSESPQGQGTGTEEWGGGGDYWGGRNMTLPFAGHPCGAPSAKEAKNDADKIQSAYRFLLADLFPFGKNARIQLEHGGTNESAEHYETVTYWYGLPGATLIQTDDLKIGHAQSENSHDYVSPDASPPYEIRSRYELDVDHLGDREIYPEQTKVGRTTTGTSEFALKLDPNNWGVLLRRTLDYQFPNQRAEVSVRDKKGDWRHAGVWYTAGSNTCVYSNPKEELGPTQHVVQTSNRRFRDDEFLIGRDLTRGRDRIRVRVKFTPIERPLFPGTPFPQKPAWSEIRYAAYSYVMPPVP